jgi:aminomethyltransferase
MTEGESEKGISLRQRLQEAPVTNTTPLHAEHERSGASFTDFAGYDMPLRYSSDLAEHHAVRENAGMFDLSHMAEIMVTGAQAAQFMDYALSNRLSVLENSQAKYSLLLAAHGGVIDDLIVYRLGESEYMIVANAANREAAFTALTERTPNWDVIVEDSSDDWALIAVQGPIAKTIVDASAIDTSVPLEGLRYYRMTEGTFQSNTVYVARTGYTGEDGYEIFVPSPLASALWDEFKKVGAPHQMTLCGLACRDTLRLEAGMPLYGHELGRDFLPAQAGLGRVVVQEKEDFVGKEALANTPQRTRVLVGLVAEGKRAPRAGYSVVNSEGAVIGEITSGALSPTLGYPIAMAYVDSTFSDPGSELAVDVRGSLLGVRVHPLPFYTRKKVTT